MEPNTPEVAEVVQALLDRGRHAEVEHERHLVLDTQIAFSLGDVASIYQGHLARSQNVHWAARLTADELLGEEATVPAEFETWNSPHTIRLRVSHPALMHTARTLPGPADLIVYPVIDAPGSVARLSGAQADMLGGLEHVCVGALSATLAEPVARRLDVDVDGVGVAAFSGDLYVASRVLDLSRFLGEVGFDPNVEAIIGVPSARELWVVPVPDAARLGALAAPFAAKAAEAYAETRSPVSPAAYLWNGAQLERLDQAGSSPIGP